MGINTIDSNGIQNELEIQQPKAKWVIENVKSDFWEIFKKDVPKWFETWEANPDLKPRLDALKKVIANNPKWLADWQDKIEITENSMKVWDYRPVELWDPQEDGKMVEMIQEKKPGFDLTNWETMSENERKEIADCVDEILQENAYAISKLNQFVDSVEQQEDRQNLEQFLWMENSRAFWSSTDNYSIETWYQNLNITNPSNNN